MKYTAHMYAKALAEAARDAHGTEENRVVKNFLALLEQHGDLEHLPKILEEAGRLVRAQGGVRKVDFLSARKLTASQRKTMLGFIKKDDVVEERIDPGLIAGIRIVVNDELQFDGSLQGKLNVMLGAGAE